MATQVRAWRPRSSQMGSYLSCSYRAAFDKLIHDGVFKLDPEQEVAVTEAKKSSPFASFGTWGHFYLQDALRCIFEGGRDEHLIDDETKASAATLHGNDLLATEAAIRVAATLAAKHMPLTKDGKPWIAEASCSSRNLTGHLDFLSHDFLDVVDLKMTTRKPLNGAVKAEHFVQVAGAYPYLVRERYGITPHRATVLYVSMRGDWVCPVVIDLTTPERLAYIDQIGEYAKYLKSKQMLANTMPVFGTHCSEQWCPYKSICRDVTLPKAADIFEVSAAPVQGMKIQGLL